MSLESKAGEVYAYADNLLNQTYDTYGFYSAPVTYGAPARRPRWASTTSTPSEILAEQLACSGTRYQNA